MTTATKVILVNSLIALVVLSTFAFFSVSRFHVREVKEESENLEKCLLTFRELLRLKGGEFRVENGRLFAGSYLVNGNFEVPDKVQEIFGGVATVFLGDTRVSTNVLDGEKKRAVGTKLVGAAYDALFRQGKAYRGEAFILGVPYLTAYDPIWGKNGEIIGVLFVGIKKSEFLAHIQETKMQQVLMLSVLMVIFITLMVLLGRATNAFEKTKVTHLRFLQTLIDTIPSPIFYKDAKGRYLGCNNAFESAVKMTRAELIGKTVHELWPRELADLYRQKDLDLFRNPGEQVYEATISDGHGQRHDVIFRKATFQGDDGTLGGLVGVIIDVTELKAAEDEAKHAYQQLFDIVEFLPDATFVVNRDQQVIAWNRAMEKMTGVAKEEMLGKGNYEYAIPFYGVRRPMLINLLDVDDDALVHSYDSVEKVGKTLSVEVSVSSVQDGAERDFWSTASPLFDKNGNQVGGIQSLRDITERKRAEESRSQLMAQLHHARMMEAVMCKLGHDLKTPLTPLLVLLPLIKERAADPELKRMADICYKNSCHINELSDRTFSLAELATPSSPGARQEVALARSVEESLLECAVMGARKDVSVQNEIDPSILVQGVPEQIRELCGQLIANAVRYSPPQGVVRINAEETETWVTLAVRDNGIGIAAENLSRIFDDFFKVDESRHDVATPGLGLAICQRIAHNHQGKIWAESRGIGEGTTIRCALPQKAA